MQRRRIVIGLVALAAGGGTAGLLLLRGGVLPSRAPAAERIPPVAVAVDLDADGLDEVAVAAGGVTVWQPAPGQRMAQWQPPGEAGARCATPLRLGGHTLLAVGAGREVFVLRAAADGMKVVHRHHVGECVHHLAPLDAEGDGDQELVVTTSVAAGEQAAGGVLRVLGFETRRSAPSERVQWLKRQLNPQEVDFGDVDGDGIEDVLVTVFKEAPFDQVTRLRPFVYARSGLRLEPKWRGSRLSRPFDRVFIASRSPGDLLAAVEQLRDDRRAIMVYEWSGFGFAGWWESEPWERIATTLATDVTGDGLEDIVALGRREGTRTEVALYAQEADGFRTACRAVAPAEADWVTVGRFSRDGWGFAVGRGDSLPVLIAADEHRLAVETQSRGGRAR